MRRVVASPVAAGVVDQVTSGDWPHQFFIGQAMDITMLLLGRDHAVSCSRTTCFPFPTVEVTHVEILPEEAPDTEAGVELSAWGGIVVLGRVEARWDMRLFRPVGYPEPDFMASDAPVQQRLFHSWHRREVGVQAWAFDASRFLAANPSRGLGWACVAGLYVEAVAIAGCEDCDRKVMSVRECLHQTVEGLVFAVHVTSDRLGVRGHGAHVDAVVHRERLGL